jgi:hypothetical protein
MIFPNQEEYPLKLINRMTATVAATLLLMTGGSVAMEASAAPFVRVTGAKIPGGASPLSNCAVTFAPHATSNTGRTCLRQGVVAGRAFADHPCAVDVYGGGPYGSDDWKNDWKICFIGSATQFLVPWDFNDQASSWDSCADGVFFDNQPFTVPNATFPQNSSGNFPRGGVANDALSSLDVRANNFC